MNIPDTLRRTMLDLHGRNGHIWLERLRNTVRACEEQWDIQVHAPYPNLTYHVVAPATGRDGTPYVLKLGPPNQEFSQEIRALERYAGDCTAHLIQADPSQAAMLLERLEPGVSRWHAQDDETSTRVAGDLMKRLWRTVPNPFEWRSLDSWMRALMEPPSTAATALPAYLLEKAQALYRRHAGITPPVLLHADLHHDNLLSATREPYFAIDPKGIVGDAGYDIGPFLINPMPGISTRPDLRKLLERRVTIFSELLGLDPHEIAAWGLIHAVLAACWSLEDHGSGWEAPIACAAELERLV